MATKTNKKANVPNLRFPGFEGEWEKKKFSEIGEFFKGSGISKDQLSGSGNPCILYGELYTKYKNEVIKEVISKTHLSAKGLVRGRYNDIIIPSSGESAEDIATACCVNVEDVLLGGDLNVIRPYKDNGNFISYQLNGRRKFEIAKIAQGSSVVHLYNEGLKKLVINLPLDIEEQNKVAILLSLIDDRIQAQIKIIEQLETLIKGFRESMFCDERKSSPRLRFRQFQVNWNKTRLSDFVSRVTRKNRGNQTTLPLTIAAKHGLVDQVTFFNNQIASKDMSNYYLLLKGEFAYNKSYSNDYPLGAIKRLDLYDLGALSTLYLCFKPSENINSDFLVHYFETAKWYGAISDIAGEGARNHGLLNISVQDFFNTFHMIPNTLEQNKIASFHDLLSKKLKLEKNLIKTYNNQKTKLLQELFI